MIFLCCLMNYALYSNILDKSITECKFENTDLDHYLKMNNSEMYCIRITNHPSEKSPLDNDEFHFEDDFRGAISFSELRLDNFETMKYPNEMLASYKLINSLIGLKYVMLYYVDHCDNSINRIHTANDICGYDTTNGVTLILIYFRKHSAWLNMLVRDYV